MSFIFTITFNLRKLEHYLVYIIVLFDITKEIPPRARISVQFTISINMAAMLCNVATGTFKEINFF